MKTSPDPLLDAVVAGELDSDEAALATMLTGARHRRRSAAVRRLALGLAVPLVVMALWLSLRPPTGRTVPSAAALTTTVRTSPLGLQRVATRSEGLVTVSTASHLASYEIVEEDQVLLTRLPAGAGFIGDGAERRLVWFSAMIAGPTAAR